MNILKSKIFNDNIINLEWKKREKRVKRQNWDFINFGPLRNMVICLCPKKSKKFYFHSKCCWVNFLNPL